MTVSVKGNIEDDNQGRVSPSKEAGMLLSQDDVSPGSNDLKHEVASPKKKYTHVQWITLATLAFGNLCVASCVSLQAPFFPRKAEQKGATPTEYGLIFGAYGITVFTSSPIIGKLISILPPKFILNSGIFTVGVTCVCFGTLDYIDERNMFVGMAFVVRILEGIGAASAQIAAFVIIASVFAEQVATTTALLASAIGIGLITGPTVGGAVYDVAGYGAPFYLVGSLLIFDAVVILFFLPNPGKQEKKRKGDWLKFWLHPVTLIYAVVIFSSFNYIGFNAATLEPHLRQFNLSGAYLGMIFAVNGMLYGISAPFWGWICDKKVDAKLISTVGCFIILMSLLLIGPMPFLHIKSGVGVTIVALCLQGVGQGAKLVCAFAGCLRDTIKRGFPSDFATYGLVSSVFTASKSLGNFVGPSVGGYLLDVLGYDHGVYVLLGLEIFVVSFLVIYGIYSRLLEKKNAKTKEKEPLLPNGISLYTRNSI